MTAEMTCAESRSYADVPRRGESVTYQGYPYRMVTADIRATLDGATVWFTLVSVDGKPQARIHHTLVRLTAGSD